MILQYDRNRNLPTGKILAIIDESVLSGINYKSIRDYIRNNFIIKGIISLPGDAFRRSASRVKTSILILRLKNSEETQPDIFMAKSVYLGLGEKIAKRLGISQEELERCKEQELKEIVKNYQKFEQGISGDYIVSISKIGDRLDPKYCFNNNSRKKT